MTQVVLFRAARLAGGLTLREVGDAATLDPSAVAHYESQRANPSEHAAVRWRQALVRLLTQRGHEITDVLKRL